MLCLDLINAGERIHILERLIDMREGISVEVTLMSMASAAKIMINISVEVR
jgi:hypothetical protein